MDSLSAVETGRHEYQMKAWSRMLLLPFGMLFLILALFFGAVVQVSAAKPSIPLFTVLLLGGAGVYMLAQLTRARLIIDGTRIEVRGAFTTKSADLSDIEGFRTISTRNGSYTQLQLKHGLGSISIRNSFDTDEAYRVWFRQIPDLDQRSRRQILDEIEHEAELGATPEERLSALATAKTWGVFLSIVSGIVAGAMIFAPEDFRIVPACVLSILPIAAILLLLRSPLLYAVFKPKADPRAELSYILILCGFGLILNLGKVSFVSFKPLLYYAVPICAIYLAALMNAARKGSSRPGTFIALIFFAAMYSMGLPVATDIIADHSPATTHATLVVGKHITHGRSNTYSLTLSPWGPFEEPNSMHVTAQIYAQYDIGDRICLALHVGTLRVPWYQTTDCHGLQVPDSPVTHF